MSGVLIRNTSNNPRLYKWKTFQDTIGGDISDEKVDEYIVIDEFDESDTISESNDHDEKSPKLSHMFSDRVEKEVKGFLRRKCIFLANMLYTAWYAI